MPGAGTSKTVTTGALAGDISYRVQYRYGACSNQTSGYITVTVHAPTIAGTLSGNADACASDNSGTITLAGQRGAVRQWYMHDVANPAWIPVAGDETGITYSDLPLTAVYRVEVQNGICPSAFSNEVTVTVHPNPVPDFTASRTCDGDITLFTDLSTIGEGFIGSYTWQFGDGSQSTRYNPQKRYYNPDTYTVTLLTVSDMNCTASVTREVTVHPNPVSGFTAPDVCLGASTQFINTSRVRSGEDMTYEWRFGDDTRSSAPSPDYRYAAAGSYRVMMLVTTADGQCRDSVEREVAVFPPPAAFAGRDTAISAGHGARLKASGGVGYVWEPADGLSNSRVDNPLANPVQSTLYTVNVTDANGCTGTAEVNVYVNNDFRIHPYNVITPDGNGENDTWIVEHIERYPGARVSIVNRWGEEVFVSHNYTSANGWNGFNRTGDILPEGTYYYIITLEGDSRIYRGAVTLLRK
jgi:gliding motility-associated-like protein